MDRRQNGDTVQNDKYDEMFDEIFTFGWLRRKNRGDSVEKRLFSSCSAGFEIWLFLGAALWILMSAALSGLGIAGAVLAAPAGFGLSFLLVYRRFSLKKLVFGIFGRGGGKSRKAALQAGLRRANVVRVDFTNGTRAS